MKKIEKNSWKKKFENALSGIGDISITKTIECGSGYCSHDVIDEVKVQEFISQLIQEVCTEVIGEDFKVDEEVVKNNVFSGESVKLFYNLQKDEQRQRLKKLLDENMMGEIKLREVKSCPKDTIFFVNEKQFKTKRRRYDR